MDNSVLSLDVSIVGRPVPEGYAAIPICEDRQHDALRICAVVELESGVPGGHLVALRTMFDARVVLGCVVDGSDIVHEWLEFWIQDSEGLSGTADVQRGRITNAILDDRWKRHAEAFTRLPEAPVIRTPWETENPWPTFLDVPGRCPIHPKSPAGARWELCTDEAILREKGLAGYRESLRRYLCLPPAPGERPEPIPLPASDDAAAWAKILSRRADWLPFNPQAGLMLVKKHLPIPLERFIDVLSGGSWDGVNHGRFRPSLGSVPAGTTPDLGAPVHSGRLFLPSWGRYGRLLEAFHLKLGLLSDLVASVDTVVRHTQQPLLNLRCESFQVGMAKVGRGLPGRWTAAAVLVEPGEAVPFCLEQSHAQYFLVPEVGTPSAYRPAHSAEAPKGQTDLLIQKVCPESGDGITIRGTFTIDQALELASSDLVSMRLHLGRREISLWSHVQRDKNRPPGEWDFCTLPRTVASEQTAVLQEGALFRNVAYEVTHVLGTPCDLYSLAILALRILLVARGNDLPSVVKAMRSLAQDVSTRRPAGKDKDLAAQVERVCRSDPRWLESLGPQHVTWEDMGPDEAFRAIPPELWWATLALLLRMRPGVEGVSEYADFGNADPSGLADVFRETLATLDALTLKTRGLIVADPDATRQIADVIRRCLAKPAYEPE